MANINTATMKGDLNALTIGGTIKANQSIKANVIVGGGGGGELEPRVAALEEQVIVINQNMASLQDDIDTINRDVSALTDRVLINETDINTLNVDVADLKAESEELTTRITVAEQTLGALQLEVNSLSTRLDVDEETLTAVQQKVEALQNTLDNILRDITNLQQRMRNVEAGMLTLATAIQDVENDIAYYEEQGFLGKNILDVNASTLNYNIDDAGNGGPNTYINTSDYISVKPSTSYVFSFYRKQANGYIRIHEYDANRQWIRLAIKDTTLTTNRHYDEIFTTTSNCAYIRVCYENMATDVILSVGSQPISYSPYVPSNTELSNEYNLLATVDVKSEFTLRDTVNWNDSWTKIVKSGKHIDCYGRFSTKADAGTSDLFILSIPEKYRPISGYFFMGALYECWGGANVGMIACNGSNLYIIGSSVQASKQGVFHVSWEIK